MHAVKMRPGPCDVALLSVGLLRPAIAFAAVTTSTLASKGQVVQMNPGMSTQALQSEMSRAPRGATLFFAPGSYQIIRPLVVPCDRNLTLTGTLATPVTATLAASSGSYHFGLMNCSRITIEYLHFDKAGGIFADKGNHSNITTVTFPPAWSMRPTPLAQTSSDQDSKTMAPASLSRSSVSHSCAISLEGYRRLLAPLPIP